MQEKPQETPIEEPKITPREEPESSKIELEFPDDSILSKANEESKIMEPEELQPLSERSNSSS